MEKVYNTLQVAELLGLKLRTIRQYIQDGKINAKKVPGSRRWYVTESEVKRLRNETTV